MSAPDHTAIAVPAAPVGPLPTAAVPTEVLTAVAAAAAAALPSPSPLLLGPVDGSLTPDASGNAVVADFTGATSGALAIIVDPALEEALAAAASGALPVVDAVRPALEAAVAAVGPAVLGEAQLVPASAPVGQPDVAWAPLTADGEVVVWVGLAVVAAAGPVPVTTAAARRTEVGSLHLLRDVEMTLTVELGRTRMPVRDLLSLVPGSVIELDRAAGAPADLMVNGRLLARGEIVVVDEDYGLRITEIVDPGGEG